MNHEQPKIDGFWVESETPTVADVALFGQLQSLRTPLTAWQSRELTLRPASIDWLDRVDAATIPGRSLAPRLGATATGPSTPRTAVPLRGASPSASPMC